jgi:hypothetical protein
MTKCQALPRLYVYKLTTDNGGAPAVFRNKLSLAICRPKIRATAEVGDWIVGVAGQGLLPNAPLVYIMQVTEVSEDGTYYAQKSTKSRPDAVYKWKRNKLAWRPGAAFHGPEDAIRDVGIGPQYKGARVLLSTRYRYFGKAASTSYSVVAPLAHKMAQSIGRAHRVNHSDAVYDAWMKVIRTAFMKPQGRATPLEAKDESCRH